jgi:MoaA/NifB/PqqE/SkfB family radical SAM enzyme
MKDEPRIIYGEQSYSWARAYQAVTTGIVFERLRGEMVNRFLTMRKMARSRLRGHVRVINIELTNYCNQKCRFCLTGLNSSNRPKGKMDLETFKKTVEHLSPGTGILFAGFGEPFLNAEAESFIEHADRLGLTHDLEILSNFGAISEKRIPRLLDLPFKKLVISLDSMSRESFIEYKGCDDFDHVFNNITILSDEVKRRKSIRQQIIVQMVVTSKNVNEIPSFVSTIKAMKLIPRLKQLNTHNSFPDQKKIDEFEVPELSRYGNGRYLRNCLWLWGGMMVLWNGDVTICCQDARGQEVHGNVNNETTIDLLNKSPGRCEFRQRYFDDPGQVEICRKCDIA